VPITIPHLPEGQLAHAFTILSEMASEAKSLFPSRPWLTDLGAANKIFLTVGAQTPATDYLLAQQMRHMLMCHLAFLFQNHPGLVIVTPTSPMAGWPIEQENDLKYGANNANLSIRNMEYVWLANFTGCPALSCPVGYVEPKKGTGDIPIGFMGMGEWGSEDALIEWGRDVERWLNEEYPGGRRRPISWENILEKAKAK
jgi:Asp-tRNA(Asn)/Glu-tRNA(Gln) amidotransferase A subunit family amidase